MSNRCKVSGNCLISEKEAITLSRGVIRKYNSLFPTGILHLSLYPGNYLELKESIEAKTNIVVSEKTIIKLLLITQNNNNNLIFRTYIVDAFYQYAFEMSRTEYLVNGKNSSHPNHELFYNEFQQWKSSKYNYIPSIQDFTRYFIIGIEESLSQEEYNFLLLSAIYHGHASFHCFFKKLPKDGSTLSLLYKFAKINGGVRIKWRAGYLMSLFPEGLLTNFFNTVQDNDVEFQRAVIHRKVVEYLEHLQSSEPSCLFYASQVLFQITNKEIYSQNQDY